MTKLQWMGCGAILLISAIGLSGAPIQHEPTPRSSGGTDAAALVGSTLVETSASDPDWVLATSDYILRATICLSPCQVGCEECWYDRVDNPCYGTNRYFKLPPGATTATECSLAPLGTGTLDGLFIKSGVEFQMLDASCTPTGPAISGPKFVSLTVWEGAACDGFEPGTIFVTGDAGGLSDYGITIGGPSCAEILEANVCGDAIRTQVSPDGQAGTFKLELVPTTGSPIVLQNLSRTGGTYTDTFKFKSMPAGTIVDKVRVTWIIAGQTPCVKEQQVRFQYLGEYRHSQYNTPDESHPNCGGPNKDVCITTGACAYSSDVLHKKFLDEVLENGSGISLSHGKIQIEGFCQTHGFPPPASCQGKSVFRENVTINPSCSGSTVDNSTVAVGDDAPLDCGDRICINPGASSATKTVTDRCPGCNGKKQIDNFTTNGDCKLNSDFVQGKVPTIKLLD